MYKPLSLFSIAAGVILLGIFAGCASVGPSYVEPEVPEAREWNQKGEQLMEGQQEDAQWWLVFEARQISQFILFLEIITDFF